MDVTYKFSNIDGDFYLPAITKEKIDDLKVAYKGRKDDVTVVTYPKSGTTWMQQILKLMQRNGVDDTSVPTIFPWLEMYGSKKMEVGELLHALIIIYIIYISAEMHVYIELIYII